MSAPDWLSRDTVADALNEANGLHAKGLITAAMRDQIAGMAEFYHAEFTRRERDRGNLVKVRIA